MRRAIVATALLALGFAVLTKDSFALRKIERTVTERVYGFDRYVNACVRLDVITTHLTGKRRTRTLPGGEVVEVVREHRRGGIIDTKASPRTIGGWCEPADEIEWMCSEDQEPIILHSDEMPRGHLVIGSEGSGKTTALAMWHALRWFENFGEYREGGQTAPTNDRLGLVKLEIIKLWPSPWRQFADRVDFTGFELCDGSRIRFVSTAPRPERQGSPVQGYGWSWLGVDEKQDQPSSLHDDCEMRGRSSKDKGTYYKRLATATAKDDPAWRSLRDLISNGGAWLTSRLLIARSPFVAPGFLDQVRASGMTDREYRRRFLAEDVPPESRLYFNWDRAQNIRPVPLLGAKKITSIVLSRKTGNPQHALLIGHDPGTAKAASIFLDAFEVKGEPEPVWWVRAELFTLHATTEQHGLDVLALARKRFFVNLRPGQEIAHVRAMPVGQSDDKPDLDLYRIFKRIGLDTKAAQYKKDGTGTGQIKKDSRIGMINRLLCDAVGRRRLFIDCDEHGRPVAPLLVEAFETMERDERGRAETDKRIGHDKSDPADALGYALWPWEKESAAGLRADINRGIG